MDKYTITEKHIVEDIQGVFLLDEVLLVDCNKKVIELRGITMKQAQLLFNTARRISQRFRCFDISHINRYLATMVIKLGDQGYKAHQTPMEDNWVDNTGKGYEEKLWLRMNM